MGRHGYGLFAAGIAALFGAGALGASCSLETAGITGSTSSTSSVSSGAGNTGGAGGAGTGGETPSLDPESCPGADVRLKPGPSVTIPGTLREKKHDVTPSCSADPTANDLIYRVLPETDGTLKVTFSAPPEFNGSLSIRSSCKDSGVPIELGCKDKDLFQQAWVRANAPYYVVVNGTPSTFNITFSLSQCGDSITQDLEQCDGAGCTGCLSCDHEGEFWDDNGKKQRCYKFVSKKESFTDARRDCLAWGGDLAGINDTAELEFIQQLDIISSAKDLWVGGYAREPRCSYVWTDGEPGFPWNGFGMGEPTGTPGTDKKCLGINRNGKLAYSLDDQPCDTLRSYLCERAPAGTCGDGVIQPGEECDDPKDESCAHCIVRCAPDEFKDEISHHCYRLIKDAATWDAAKKSCEQSKGYLAVITSSEENTLIAESVKAALGVGAKVWLGLRVTSLSPPYGQWDRMSERPLCLERWQTGQPTLVETCATIDENGEWTDHLCVGTHGYVCERGL